MGEAETRSRVIFLIGPSGSGKTVIGRRAAEITGWSLYDTDAQILEITTSAAIGDIFDSEGEEHFRALEMQCLDQISTLGPRVIVATGGGLPAIPEAMNTMQMLGVTVYLRASLDTLWMRLQMDPEKLADRPLLRNNGKERLRQMLEAREQTYLRSSLVLDTDRLSVGDVCQIVATQVQSMEARLANKSSQSSRR